MKTKMTGSIVRCLLIAAATGASAQVTLTGTNYTETFDGTRSGLPRGWTVRTNASATSLGTPASFNPTNTSWGTQTGQFANYASTTGNGATNFSGGESTTVQGSCTNRCPGIRQTTTFGDPGAAFVLQLQNTIEFANFQLSLDCNLLSEQTNRSTVWTIDYGVGSTPVNFSVLGTYADPRAFGGTTKAFSFGNRLDHLDQNVWIRVAALDPSTGSNRCDTVGIDNFRLSYSASGTLAPIPLNIQLLGGNAVLTWSNAAFALQSAPSVAGTYTNVPGATSPYTNPAAGPQQYFRLKAN
jgi:hypothetical protein